VAAALGAGLPVLEHTSSMMIDIGGGTSEIALLSSGGIIHSQAVRVGGDAIDAAIIQQLATNQHFAIGEQTAELLKVHIASALASDHFVIEAGGLNTVSGLPERRKISSAHIFPAVDGVVKQIISAVRVALEQSPPEVAADICERGLVLAGGGALLKGLAQRFELETGVTTRLAQDPLASVAAGGARVVENFKLLDTLARQA
jgi:rod shape-determining protein MreB